MYIYGLFDPSGELRYIGKTVHTLEYRLSRHLNDLRGKSYKVNWIRNLLKTDKRPYIQMIQELYTLDDLNGAEKYWIEYFRLQGCRLTNLADGGDGPVGVKLSPESIKKRTATRRARGTTHIGEP